MGTCTLILGLPRTGTSAIAGTLRELGIDMGRRFMDIELEWNGKGSFADAEFDEIITRASDDHPPDWELPISASVLADIRTWAQGRAGDWGMKHHLLPYALDAFSHIDGLRVIRTARPKSESLASWKARATPYDAGRADDFFPKLENCIDKWLEKVQPPTLAVDFDRLLNGRELAKLSAFVGKDTNARAASFIDPDLRRFF